MPQGYRRQLLISSVLGLAFLSANVLPGGQAPEGQAPNSFSQQDLQRVAGQVHKELLKLPQYAVFDWLTFGIQGRTVILDGYASRPILKSSAENVVKRIEGVEKVQNNIEVLPLSPNDDRIRTALYAAIYRSGPLSRYTANRGGPRNLSMSRTSMGITNNPPIGWHAIHIIVKNGNVILKGVVDTTGDLSIAEMRANTTPGVFSVTNDLIVPTDEK